MIALHMGVPSNYGETSLKVARLVEWLHLNKLSNEHESIASETGVGKIKLRQDSTFKWLNLWCKLTWLLYSYN